MEEITVIQGTGKASKWVKVMLTDDPQLAADEISDRNGRDFKVKHKEPLPPWLPFEEVEEVLGDSSEESIDGWYQMTVTRVKRCIAELMDDDDKQRDKGANYVYHDDVRDREFNGEVIDG